MTDEVHVRDKFTPADLGSWISLCQTARVACVPAVQIASAPRNDILNCLNGGPEPTDAAKRFWKTVDQVRRDYGPGWMLRWSCCACADVKMQLSTGDSSWTPELMNLMVDDFRAYDIIDEFPRNKIGAWIRPWLTFDALGGYPIEYRVFVNDGEIAGISSYYPQRRLFHDDARAADVRYLRQATRTLLANQRLPMNMPQAEGRIDLSVNQCTLDFARMPSGALLFLEGGPPHHPAMKWGAHPCCFTPGLIDGVALLPRHGALVE